MARTVCAIVLATAVLRAQEPALDVVLARAADYISRYQQQLRGLVAEETYRQQVAIYVEAVARATGRPATGVLLRI